MLILPSMVVLYGRSAARDVVVSVAQQMVGVYSVGIRFDIWNTRGKYLATSEHN